MNKILIFSEYSGKLKEPITTKNAINIKGNVFLHSVKKRMLKFALLLIFVALL